MGDDDLMTINMELIDEMRKRTNCSYQEAKELLEKHNGDLIDAIIEFETRHGSQSHAHGKHKQRSCNTGNHGQKAKQAVHKGFATRVVIEKDQTVILNLSVIILLIAVLITLPAFWIWPLAFIILYLCGYKIRIKKETGDELDINNMVDEFGNKIKTPAQGNPQKPAEKTTASQKPADVVELKKEDGYHEITVE